MLESGAVSVVMMYSAAQTVTMCILLQTHQTLTRTARTVIIPITILYVLQGVYSPHVIATRCSTSAMTTIQTDVVVFLHGYS